MDLHPDLNDWPAERVEALLDCLNRLASYTGDTDGYFAEVPGDGQPYEVAISYQGLDADDGTISQSRLANLLLTVPEGLFDIELTTYPETGVPGLYVARHDPLDTR